MPYVLHVNSLVIINIFSFHKWYHVAHGLVLSFSRITLVGLIPFSYKILQETLLTDLRNTNDMLEHRNGESCLKDSKPLKKHIATVLVQLKEASVQACGFQSIDRSGLFFSMISHSLP